MEIQIYIINYNNLQGFLRRWSVRVMQWRIIIIIVIVIVLLLLLLLLL